MEVSLVWWNSSLTSTGATAPPSDSATQVATSLTGLFAQKFAADFIAIGEVSSQDVNGLQSSGTLEGFDVLDRTGQAGRSRFDICVAYRTSKLKLLSEKRLDICIDDRTLKLGQRFDFAIADYSKPLHIIVSHWPSRLFLHEDQPDRHLLGIRLRDNVKEILEAEPKANIVLLGDYNDEPFDKSLSDQLKATRDRVFARKKEYLLYNPFWRHLSTAPPMHTLPHSRAAGSYFHRQGEITKWRTFDQIIVSSSMLGDGDWVIDENMTQILDIPHYTDVVLDKANKFDHLPIISVIRRDENGEL